MKLTVGFTVVCVALYAGAEITSPASGNGNLENELKKLQVRFDFINRNMLELQTHLTEQREEVDRIFSVLQDRSKSRIQDCVTLDSTTPTTTSTTSKPEHPASCKEVTSNVSGVYLIRVNDAVPAFNVYCEQEKAGGGWIVVQHRFNGSVDFYQNWDQYRNGFGNLESEFWLGLEKMYQITKSRSHELVVEIKDFSDAYGYARYNAFQIGSEGKQYSLKTLGSYSGTAGDSMTGTNKGMKFSTKDRENDVTLSGCAQSFQGGWWYNGCTYANLNGLYKNVVNYTSMHWYTFKNDYHGLSYSRMMIREL